MHNPPATLGSRLRLAKLVLALSAAALWPCAPAPAQDSAQPAPTAPPEPPVQLSSRSTPLTYKSNRSELKSVEDGELQGYLLMREWWYWFEDVDYRYVVGVAELSVTPKTRTNALGITTNKLDGFSFALKHSYPNCSPGDSRPDPNSAGVGVEGSLAGTVAKDPEIQLGLALSRVVADDTIKIEGKTSDSNRADWQIALSDGAPLKNAGVSRQSFVSVWACPKSTVFESKTVASWGSIEIDDWGHNTVYGFSPGHTSGPGARDCHWWTFDRGAWNCRDELVAPPKQVRSDQLPAPGVPKQTSYLRLPGGEDGFAPALSGQEKQARLAALAGLRSGDATNPGTNVSPSFGDDRDPSALARLDADRQASDAERRREYYQDDAKVAYGEGTVTAVAMTPPSAMPPAEAAATVADPPMALAAAPLAMVAPPVVAEVEPTGIVGNWLLQDASSGVSRVMIRRNGGAYVLSGMGPDILLEQNGNSYVGDGAVLFGQGGHRVRLMPQGGELALSASNGTGGSFATTLRR